jgi:hypothetical protein
VVAQTAYPKSGGIAAFMVVKNGVRLGYPFLEAIRCVLPYVEEFWVADGYSDDATWPVLKTLAEHHPQVVLVQDQWPEHLPSGFAIGAATNALMDRLRASRYRWLWYVQADELYPAQLAFACAKATLVPGLDGLAVEFLHLAKNFQELQFPPGKESYTQAIRLVRNLPQIKSHRDAWTFEGCENVALCAYGKLVHANSTWWEHWAAKARNHADLLYQDLGYYAMTADQREAEVRDAREVPEIWTRTKSPFAEVLPDWIKPMVGRLRYEVRPEVLA